MRKKNPSGKKRDLRNPLKRSKGWRIFYHLFKTGFDLSKGGNFKEDQTLPLIYALQT